MTLLIKQQQEAAPCDKCESAHQSIFCGLSKVELGNLSEGKTVITYKKGQMIFYEGNHPQGLYCIYKGKVKIHKLGLDGKEQILRLAKKGNLIGYRAILSSDNYHASATALEESVICFFSKTAFQTKIAANPQLSDQIIRLLSKDLKSAEKKAMNLVQKEVRERIAETLLVLRDFLGLESDNATFTTVLTREGIGNIAGTTTETTIRVLSAFQKSKVIQLVGKKIRILNMEELVRLANLTD